MGRVADLSVLVEATSVDVVDLAGGAGVSFGVLGASSLDDAALVGPVSCSLLVVEDASLGLLVRF